MEAQLAARRRAEELHGYMADLLGWEKEMKAKERAAKQQKADGRSLPPVRGAAAPPAAAAAAVKPPASPPVTGEEGAGAGGSGAQPPAAKHPAGHTYDHYRDRWERFDLDTALAEADKDGCPAPTTAPTSAAGSAAAAAAAAPPRSPAPAADASSNTSSSSSPVPIPVSRVAPQPRGTASGPTAKPASSSQAATTPGAGASTTAAGWRERGNAHFRRGEHAQAAGCYSQAVALDPGCHLALANRAMARLKLGQAAGAEADCSAALALAPSYVKAWQRRWGWVQQAGTGGPFVLFGAGCSLI